VNRSLFKQGWENGTWTNFNGERDIRRTAKDNLRDVEHGNSHYEHQWMKHIWLQKPLDFSTVTSDDQTPNWQAQSYASSAHPTAWTRKYQLKVDNPNCYNETITQNKWLNKTSKCSPWFNQTTIRTIPGQFNWTNVSTRDATAHSNPE
jgi:hypothetical protein